MRGVVQRVNECSVIIDGKEISRIGKGLLLLLGIADGDSEADISYMVDKVSNLRIFTDTAGKFNESTLDIKGEILVVSKFTLCGDARKGRRPDFTAAAKGETAKKLYEGFVEKLKSTGLNVATGEFQAHMVLGIKNDGPVTIILDSKKQF